MMNISDFQPPELSARERILVAAHDLFYRDGIRATGIDKVIAQAGITKVTFYRHFPSKNALIRAFLEYRHQRWMTWFKDALLRHGATAGGGLAPLVPTLAEWLQNPIYRGCAFINSVSELSNLAEVVEISAQHKQDMIQAIAELLPPSPERETWALAAALAVDGAIVKAQFEYQTAEKPEALAGLAVLLAALDNAINATRD